MKRKYTTKRGESWDSIKSGLNTLVRRQASQQRPLGELQMVYEVIALAKRYEEEGSLPVVAAKLEEKSKSKTRAQNG